MRDIRDMENDMATRRKDMATCGYKACTDKAIFANPPRCDHHWPDPENECSCGYGINGNSTHHKRCIQHPTFIRRSDMVARAINPRYTPKTLEQKLGYLVEECGEVLQAVGKSQRWGLDSVNPELPVPVGERETNRDWLLRELHDLQRAILFVHETISTAPASPARTRPVPRP